jgi:branched-chain amino acid transport system substrate-binding protein
VTEGRKFVFRIGALADVEAKALAVIAKETLGAHRVAILYQANLEYSRTIAEAFSREFHAGGGLICAVEKFVPSSPDLAAIIGKIKASAPEAILLPNSTVSVLATGTLLRQAGVQAVLIGPDSWSRMRLRSLPEFDGCYMVTNWCPGVKSPESEKFVEAYRKKFNAEPTETAALTYDACRVLFAALRLQTDISPRAIRDTLTTMADVDCVSGRLQFRDGVDPVKSLTLIRFKSGQEIFSTLPSSGTVR